MASSVPLGIALPGFLRSPDMLAPAVMPVAAGKKMAKADQKPTPPEKAGPLLAAKSLGSNSRAPPTMKLTTAISSTPSTANWALSATSAPLKVRMNRPATTTLERICGTRMAAMKALPSMPHSVTLASGPCSSEKTASVKPMV